MIKDEFIELRALAVSVYGEKSDMKSIVNFPFVVASNLLDTCEEPIKMYGLTPVEILALAMLQGFHYREVQDFRINNEFISLVREALDSALEKIPQTQFERVYRNDKYIDLKSFIRHYKVDDIYVHPCYLTASKDDFDNAEFKFFIKPLLSGKTKGHDIFLVYNHGLDSNNPEFQVQFEKGTKFRIERFVKNGVYLSEIE